MANDLCAVKEIGLQNIWAQQAFYPQHLKTDSGRILQILHRGDWNHQNGPDFLNAQISIDGILLYGAIEIHTKASDWYAHQHHTDPRYNQTVLHVVFDNNKDCYLENGQALECLQLKHRIDQNKISEFQKDPLLPCLPLLSLCDKQVKESQLNIALTKRMNEKTSNVLSILQQHNGDWWFTALELIFTAWMGKANQSASQRMIQHLQKPFMMRNRNPITLTAYLFGQAGWLGAESSDMNKLEDGQIFKSQPDNYHNELIHRYEYLQLKHGFAPCNPLWNTKQIRPSAFPQIRMAQFSEWLMRCDADLQILFHPPNSNLRFWIDHFSSNASDYWKEHFSLGNASAQHVTHNGRQHTLQVITNGLIPFLFAYGLESHKPQHSALAMDLLEQLPAEHNRITKQLDCLGIKNSSTKISQSLIGQHRQYCSIKRCKDCGIGRHILNLPFMGSSP